MNDYLPDLLRVKQYYVTDLSGSGRSGTHEIENYESGQLYIAIRDPKSNGVIKTVIETFRINSCGAKNQII